MQTNDAAVEAEVELDGTPLRRKQYKDQYEHGEDAAHVAPGGVRSLNDNAPTPAEESSPLLGQRSSQDGEGADNRASETEAFEFAQLPWTRRPSIYWMIGPFFIVACAFGGILTPKLNLIIDLVCREYYLERMLKQPGFTMIPIEFNSGHNNQCRIPAVQSKVAQFNLWASLIAGLLSAVSSPKLGALSDRYGRKPILAITSVGTICGEIVTIFAASYPATFPVPLLLLSFALDGLTGSFIVAMAISNAYASDCTPPSTRNISFGVFHGCLFTGIALGPIIAGYISKMTGQIVVVFYVLTAVHVVFVVFVLLVVPESLSKPKQAIAREKHRQLMAEKGPSQDWINQLRAFNILEPLKILRPTGPSSTPKLRRNLLVLSAVDTIVFGLAMGAMPILVTYSNYKFGWETFESGRFVTIISSSRVISLIIILPILTRLVRGPSSKSTKKNTGCDLFDLIIIRLAVIFDTVGFLGYTLADTPAFFILSGIIAALGGMASPTLQSSLTKHVPPDRSGQLLGAVGMLHALARVVAPTVFNAIYAATVGKYTPTVFLCLTVTFGLAAIVSWFIRPRGKSFSSSVSCRTNFAILQANAELVYWDEDTPQLRENGEGNEEDGERASGGRSEEQRVEHDHMPIGTAVGAAFGTLSERVKTTFSRSP